MKSVVREIAAATTVLLALAGGAGAATETNDAATAAAPTACLRVPALLSTEAVAAFKLDTAALLSSHPEGGVELVRQVRGLVGSDISTLELILKLLKPEDASKAPNELQLTAIGNGLAQAAQACVAASLEEPKALGLAEKIQLAILESGIPVLVTAFNGGVGNTLSAALGGPGSGGAAGGGDAGGSTGGGAAGLGAGDGGPGGVVVGGQTANGGGSSFGGASGGGFSSASNGGNGTPSPTTP